MKKRISKWEWIEEECRKLGYTQSAEYARLIEAVLKVLYGNTMTKNKQEWGRFQKAAAINGVTALIIRRVMADSSFCIACERTPGTNCDECLFQKIAGGCGDNASSLYNKFVTSLYAEAYEI
jgi:hypothetical protein